MPPNVGKVKNYRNVTDGFFGKASSGVRYPGSFADLDRAGARSVDPRRMR